MLGSLVNISGFDYQSSEEVLREVRARCAEVKPAPYQGTHSVAATVVSGEDAGLVDVPMYHVDALVRRAPSLQRTREGRSARVAY